MRTFLDFIINNWQLKIDFSKKVSLTFLVCHTFKKNHTSNKTVVHLNSKNSSNNNDQPLTFSNILIIQYVVSSVAVDPVHSEDLNDGVAEAAHGLNRSAFHEDHHLVLLHHLLHVLLARGGAHEAGPTRQNLSIILSCSVMPRARSKTPGCRSENVVHCTSLKGLVKILSGLCMCVTSFH